MADVHSKEVRSYNMSRIKGKNTKMEVKLAQMLWSKGHRFRRNSKYVFGKPDFSSKKYKLAIFVDGEYFHGKDWETEKYRIKSNRDFWWKKIESNIERDKIVNKKLQDEGWKVLRFWSNDVKKNAHFCLSTIETEIDKLKNDQILRSQRKTQH